MPDATQPRTVHQPVRLAYLLNQYPQPSQTFIRRELNALEQLGQPVERFTIRSWAGQLIDPQDIAEKARTRAVLDARARGLLGALTLMALRHPARLAKTFLKACSLGRTGDRGVLWHLFYLTEACVLLRWWQQSRIEHVHVHFGTNAATVAMLARLLGGPAYSFTVHGPEEFDRPGALHLKQKIRHAEFAVAISHFGRSQLCRWSDYGDWKKLRVVRCGLDEQFLHQSLTPPPRTAKLVCIARLEEQKGLLVLVEATAWLRRRAVPFELVIIGDGAMRGEIERLIALYDLEDTVRLLGWQSSDVVRAELLSSRAMVLPSFAEGLPVVIMEALAVGRPVISTYVGGIAELVEPGVCGWLIPAGAVAPLAEAMRVALDAPGELLAQYGQAGRDRVAQRHVAQSEAGALLAAIRGESDDV